MTEGKDFADLIPYLSAAGALAEHVKRMMCKATGLSEEEVAVDIDPFGNITARCKPKAAMETVEMEIILDGEERLE